VLRVVARGDMDNAQLEAWIRDREDELTSITGSLNEAVEVCRRERSKLMRDWETIRTAGPEGSCPLCHQRLGEHFPQLEREFEGRLQEIVTSAEQACRNIDVHEKERTRLTALRPLLARMQRKEEREAARIALLQERQMLEGERGEILRERGRVDAQLHELGFDATAFSLLEEGIRTGESAYKRYREVEKKIATLPLLRHQRAEVHREREEKWAEQKRILEELAGTAFDSSAETDLQNELVRLRKERIAKESDLARDRERHARILESIQRLRELQERIREVKKEQDSLAEEVRLLKLTRSMVSEFVIYLMQVVRAQIEQRAGEVLSAITDSRYDRVLLDTEFNLRISDLDNDYPIERFSGGEQDDIAVALRIALSHYLAELHQVHDSTFLIFDEIFASQDEERRNNLLRALRTQESHFPQIILISHIPEIQGEFATTLMVEMESEQTSVVRVAS
jgi:ATPase involved in DNA repair